MDVELIETGERDGATVEDLIIRPPAGDPRIEAYRVRPAATAGPPTPPGAGIVFAHWFDPEAPDGDRTQFLDEAVALAALGATSILPAGRFPWQLPPAGAAADAAAIAVEVRRLRTALAVLIDDPAVDPTRLALVGHDFGGMAAIVAASADGPLGQEVADRVAPLAALIVIAATPRWGDWFLPFWPIPDDRLDYLRALRPFDPVERIGAVRASNVLLQMARADFYIAPMSGLELQRAGPTGTRIEAYDSDHAMRDPGIRADRGAVLVEALGLTATAS